MAISRESMKERNYGIARQQKEFDTVSIDRSNF